MSRKTGTRAKDYKSKRARYAQKDRLNYYLRRFGIALALLLLAGWGAAWFFLSDANERFAAWTHASFVDKSADAGMTVQDILIEGRNYTDADLLKALINMEKGDPLVAFKPAEVQHLIEDISWVERAEVSRRFPNTIYIRLYERVPYALWQHDGKVVVIDREGEVLTEKMRPEFEDLFLITGEDANKHAEQIVSLLQTEALIMEESEAAMRVGGRRWDLTLKNGMTVYLPEDDIGYALRRLADEQEETDIFAKDLRVIDLREPDRLIVQTHTR